MTHNLTITANSKIVKVRIWINPVISEIVFQPPHTDTDMSKNSINGVETTVRDGRGFNMTLNAHSLELLYQKTSLSTDDFYNHPERITDVCYAELVEMFTSSITSYALLKTILTATDLTHHALWVLTTGLVARFRWHPRQRSQVQFAKLPPAFHAASSPQNKASESDVCKFHVFSHCQRSER